MLCLVTDPVRTEYAESVHSECDTLCSAFLQYINGIPIIERDDVPSIDNAVIVAMIFKDSYLVLTVLSLKP